MQKAAGNCCVSQTDITCAADNDCNGTNGGSISTDTCGTGNCANPLMIEETYQINVDTYKAITLPEYDLTPACVKTKYFHFTDQNDQEIPWIKYNSTSEEY